MTTPFFIGQHFKKVSKNSELSIPKEYLEIIDCLYEKDKRNFETTDMFHVVKTPDSKMIHVCRGTMLDHLREKCGLSEIFEDCALNKTIKGEKLILPQSYLDHIESGKNEILMIFGAGDHFLISTQQEAERERKEICEELNKMGITDPIQLLKL